MTNNEELVSTPITDTLNSDYWCDVCNPDNCSGCKLPHLNNDMQPKGEWVDLTDRELEQIESETEPFDHNIAHTVIAKFKSKNTPPVVPEGEPVGRFYWESIADGIVVALPSCGTPHFEKDDFPLYTTTPTAAQAARQMRDAAVKVCREHIGYMAEMIAEAIAALPVPEVQWRDLTDDEIKQAAWGYVEDSKNLDKQRMLFARAVIAAFKEKNK